MKRRRFLKSGACGIIAADKIGPCKAQAAQLKQKGYQRLSLEQLKAWESLQYGMFIHYGMSTFDGDELSDGKSPPSLYAPDKLDVGQWISVARDAGMKYAVLTTKHVAGHCLWPSRDTSYTVTNSGNTTDVVGAFVRACEERGIKPGFYYCSWDNHNKFGSMTPTDVGWNLGMNSFPKTQTEKLPPFTTSLFQNFQTAQITDLMKRYGPILEIWVDIPGILGMGYRTFLYEHIASLQPDIVIMMNTGFGDGSDLKIDYAWPSDLVAIERDLPSESGHEKWKVVDGKVYYVPGEVCDPIGKEWFFKENDLPRSDDELLRMYSHCKRTGVNLLLNVPPDKHGLIPDKYIQALMRLRKNAGL